MLGGSGGGGAGGGGAGLAAALNSMLQSPQMQALATQLESASNGTARVPSSVAVEERHADGVYGIILSFKSSSSYAFESVFLVFFRNYVLFSTLSLSARSSEGTSSFLALLQTVMRRCPMRRRLTARP